MTRQEIFDRVVRHLLSQKQKAAIDDVYGNTRCRYRTPDGLRCAVGCLIPDDAYDPSIEGFAVGDLLTSEVPTLCTLRRSLEAGGVPCHDSGAVALLRELQTIHDP